MFDPSQFDFNYDELCPVDYDVEHLAISHLNDAIHTLPSEDFVFDLDSNGDNPFRPEDFEFAKGILSDPDVGSGSRSPGSHSLSDSPETMGSNPECLEDVEQGSDVARVLEVEHAQGERGLSGRGLSHDSGNREADLSKASDNQSSGSNFKQKLDYQSAQSRSCDQFSSQGSGEFNSGVSPVDDPPSPDSCQGAPQFSCSFNVPTLKTEGRIEIEEDGSKCTFKRKKEQQFEGRIEIEEDGSKCTFKRKKEQQFEGSTETRINKFRKSSGALENETVDLSTENMGEDKKKARLMRNRESAQLSRQRKKQYVDELEGKVKSMHSTISELNTRISYIMAENATLRQQLGGPGVCPPPPLPGMYPMAPMGYPWMPCPPYVVKPQGSQLPLIPIPRLKPQQYASAPKASKKSEKSENKKNMGKTKKLASISFLGLLFFMLLFGGLVPIVSVKHGGKTSISDKFRMTNKGRILMDDGHLNKTSHGGPSSDRIYSHESGIYKGKQYGTSKGQNEHSSQFKNGMNGSVPVGNSSEPLAASLFVPRNDKLVKIDGNLIIHSVLASEKSKSFHGKVQMKTSEETRLAIARNYPPSHDASSDQSNTRGSPSHPDDGPLQQWFSEDLSGSLLSSGMCTEVFQFDVSPGPGSIVPATSIANVTSDSGSNSTNLNKSRNRRILSGHPVPLDLHALNITKEHVRQNTEKDGLQGNKSRSSMVVSVLVDPREASEVDGEGVMRSKSTSRIFVVVLIDSVKYVTYSCMLPLMGSGPHLVTM